MPMRGHFKAPGLRQSRMRQARHRVRAACAAHDVKGRARAARRGCVTCFKLSPNLRKAAAAAGEPGAGAADVARLDAVMEVAIKSDVAPDLAAEPAMAGQQPRGC